MSVAFTAAAASAAAAVPTPETVRRPSTWACLHRFNVASYWSVLDLEVRVKRGIYAHMRVGRPSADMFFPAHGISAGEFAVFKVLGENVRRGNAKQQQQQRDASDAAPSYLEADDTETM